MKIHLKTVLWASVSSSILCGSATADEISSESPINVASSVSSVSSSEQKPACLDLFDSIKRTKASISSRTLVLREQLAEIERLEAKISPLEVYVDQKSKQSSFNTASASEYNHKFNMLKGLVSLYNLSVGDYDSLWEQQHEQITNTNVAVRHYSHQCTQQNNS